MEKQTTVHIISHTHWDREWFLNSPFTNEWLLDFFDSLFAMLEKEPNYKFVLDGQTLIIEDYLEQLQIRGRDANESRKKIKRFVENNRLLIGPYYLQPDWNLVSGEALIKNLLIGDIISSSFGNRMDVGWLLDNFGQISQAVQIHKGFGLIGVYVWRGVEMNPENVSLEFMWEAPDHSALLAVYLLDSYRNAMQLSKYPAIARDRILHEIEKLKPFATTTNILLMNGYDQETIPDDLMPVLRKVKIPNCVLKQSDPETYIEAVRKENPKLQVIKGQLYSGRYISVFPGTLSARMYLKILNTKVQNVVEKEVEPIVALAWALGFTNDYDLISIWKNLLKNHPHDSICGVSVDSVHSDMEERFAFTRKRAKDVIRSVLRNLVPLIDTFWLSDSSQDFRDDSEIEVYLIFNLSPFVSEKLVKIKAPSKLCEFLDSRGRILETQKTFDGSVLVNLGEIPPIGYSILYARSPESNEEKQKRKPWEEWQNREIENEYYRIRFAEDGSLTIYDKNRGEVYEGMGVYEDGADAGDTYNYSPCIRDTIYTSCSSKAKVEIVESGGLRSVVKIKHELKLPVSVEEDRKARSKNFMILPIITYVVLEKNSQLIKFRTVLKNTVKDHRLRVLFPTRINTDSSIASSQFDVVEHPIKPSPYDDSKISPELGRLLLGAREPSPTTVFPNNSFVDVSDGKRGVALITKGLPEYEVLDKNNTIALTLFRAVGWLARGDLLTRIGDAGPAILTPEAQCLRTMEFEYALYIHEGDWSDGRVYWQAEHFNRDDLVVKTDLHSGILPNRKSFVRVLEGDSAVGFSIFKVSEDRNGLILRFFNPDNKSTSVKIEMDFGVIEAFYTDLRERVIKPVKKEGSCITVAIGSKEIVTVKVVVDRIKSNISNGNGKVFVDLCEKTGITGEDFSNYDSLEVITRREIEEESLRVKKILEQKEEVEREVSSLEKNYKDRKKKFVERELEILKGELATLERELLEAELSLLLSKKKHIELNPEDDVYKLTPEKIEETLRELGYKLNIARVKKRTYDYISEYYKSL